MRKRKMRGSVIWGRWRFAAPQYSYLMLEKGGGNMEIGQVSGSQEIA
jgi:hypothetical protein